MFHALFDSLVEIEVERELSHEDYSSSEDDHDASAINVDISRNSLEATSDLVETYNLAPNVRYVTTYPAPPCTHLLPKI
jgi:hypothetical protein